MVVSLGATGFGAIAHAQEKPELEAQLRDPAISSCIKAWPMRMGVPGAMPSASLKPVGAKTMIVEPCSNQPSSWPLVQGALQGISVAPR